MAKPALILVGADKGGVGKTTVARTLLDYFTAHHVPTRAFDTETPKGTLKRFHRDVSEVVDATAVADQMRIIDTLSTTDATVTVVDVRAALMSPTLHALRDIGFLDAVKKGTDHLCGVPHPRLVDRFAERDRGNFAVHRRRRIFPGQELHQQHQFLRVGSGDACLYFKKLKDAVVIEIPKLNEMAYEQVELASVPFLTFVANKDSKAETTNYSFVLRGYVRHWLGNVWAEYDRVKLLDLVGTAAETTPARAQAGGRS
jgi:hypothetical protein